MTSVPSPSTSVAIIGAGPYGLAAAAHLRHAGVDTHVFGEVMEFWHRQMPTGMVLRSRKRSSSISDPRRELTIERFGKTQGDKMANASLAEFLSYAHWFQRETTPDIDPRKVKEVDLAPGGGFRLTLVDDEVVEAERVVIAAGLFPFARRPAPFDGLPPSLVSHSSDHEDLGRFAGKNVAVVGAGQSTLESAALLHEVGARVEVLARSPKIIWLAADSPGSDRTLSARMTPPTDVGGRVTGWIAAFPDAFRRLPKRLQPVVSRRCVQPAGAPWLVERLMSVPLTTGRTVRSAKPAYEGVLLELDDRSQRQVDHVLLGTGYRVDVARYPFMAPQLLESLQRIDGYPRLGPGLESSIPGLHFIGAPAAVSFGPIMRFVVGTWYAAPALTLRVLGKPQPSLRFSH